MSPKLYHTHRPTKAGWSSSHGRIKRYRERYRHWNSRKNEREQAEQSRKAKDEFAERSNLWVSSSPSLYLLDQELSNLIPEDIKYEVTPKEFFNSIRETMKNGRRLFVSNNGLIAGRFEINTPIGPMFVKARYFKYGGRGYWKPEYVCVKGGNGQYTISYRQNLKIPK